MSSDQQIPAAADVASGYADPLSGSTDDVASSVIPALTPTGASPPQESTATQDDGILVGGAGLDTLSLTGTAAAPEDAHRKAQRFVSESHLPVMQHNYGALPPMYGAMGQGVPAGMAGMMPMLGLHQGQVPSQQQSAQLNDAQNSQLAQSGGSTRSFSGNLLSHGPAGLSGLPAPTSPYLAHQYAAALAAGAGGASGVHGQQPAGPQAGGYSMGGAPPAGFYNPAALYMPNHAAMVAAAAAAGAPNGMNAAAFLGPHNMAMLGHHHHAAAPPPLPPQMQANATGRTVYVGNLPAEASVDELLSQVKFGPIENVRLLPEKNCAFISFLDGNMAAAFHADASVKKLSLHNQELKIGWGKPSACPTPVYMAVQQNQATRNVYLGQLDDDTTEQSLRDDLARFGPIDQVKIVRDKNIGFVHFLSIGTAMKVVSMLPTEPSWAGKRVNYGKDRCAYVPKSQQQNQAHNNQAAAMGMAAAASLGYPTGLNPAALGAFGGAANGNSNANAGGGGVGGGINDDGRSPTAVASVFAPMANTAALQQMGNRTVYLGNIHPDTSAEEICNHIRGGILQNIRFIPEKHIAFITFVEANAALAFFHLATFSGIMIHQRRLKVGWGKHSGPLSPAIAMAVQTGGSRNVYIGNIEDFDVHTVEKLRNDFSEYGETELVNTFKEKNCAFVNFCNIQNAIKAIEAMKNHADYVNQRIGAGKDRCGNPPRVVANTLHARGGTQSPPPQQQHAPGMTSAPSFSSIDQTIIDSSPPEVSVAGEESGTSIPAATAPDVSLGAIVAAPEDA